MEAAVAALGAPLGVSRVKAAQDRSVAVAGLSSRALLRSGACGTLGH